MLWRSPLFIPASRPTLLPKARAGGADAVIVDLEDAVAAAAREDARAGLAELLPTGPGTPVAVRVNGPRTHDFPRDMEALAPLLGRVAFLVVPMVGTPADVGVVEHALSEAERRAGVADPLPIMPMVESAEGVWEARAIVGASRRVATLAFGPADLASELGITATRTGEEFRTARSLLVLACAAAGVAPPLDGPHLDLSDEAGLASAAAAARALGFGGKLAVHPRQLGAIRREFTPSAEELEWAEAVDRAFTAAESAGSAAIRLDDGTFVDYPVARRARALLGKAV